MRRLGLDFSTDRSPGYSRKISGKHFSYFDPGGNRVKDARQLSRFKSLAIPPAWSKVWICTRESGHLQATGRDQKGRRQAIYHPEFRAHREETKFESLKEFGLTLPQIRARVERDMAIEGMPREKVLAAVVRLLEATLIRVGNRRYAVENASYGLTTLKSRHLLVKSEILRFRFRGKGGKFHQIEYRDRRLARIARSIQELPGQALFQFMDETGTSREITSDDVNAYLREVSGRETTAKEFRTWRATIETLRLLRATFEGVPLTKKSIGSVIEQVAQMLGNTSAICRKSYVHPRLLENTSANAPWLTAKLPRSQAWMEPIERLAIEKLL